jgi:CxxC motif-containing protein (DUF1111 family)
VSQAQTDPGLRAAGAATTTAGVQRVPQAGDPVAGLTANELRYFEAGKEEFEEIQTVDGRGGTEAGLGPRFNLNSCAGCHAFPAIGGTSPRTNPQVSVGPPDQVSTLMALNIIRPDGPVREVRFKSDGGVHDLFTIKGMPGTPPGCHIAPPDFARAMAERNVIFRIPTPTFGLGLIEAISDATIMANQAGFKPFGISGRLNRNGNDGTVTRFGWKAQNKSLLIFSGEAYNVEQGITNELFPDERGEGGRQDSLACSLEPVSQDHTDFDTTLTAEVPSGAAAFANFMRFLAPPPPAFGGYTASNGSRVDAAAIAQGAQLFAAVGCAVCHTPSLDTGRHYSAVLSNKKANLYSDLLLHGMGTLGDGIRQGDAGPNEFRTAPLWGLGQRIFLLHDGRTTSLLEAIQEHAGNGADRASEAYEVVRRFNSRTLTEKQNILNFLRAL